MDVLTTRGLIRCNECQRMVTRAVEIGDSSEYGGSPGVTVCRDCLAEALALLDAADQASGPCSAK